MSGVLAPQWLIQALTDAGAVASGAKLYSYIAGGGTVPTPLYADKALTTPLTNPYQFDSAGRGGFWLDEAIMYRLRLETSGGTLLWERDGVEGSASALGWVKKTDLASDDPTLGSSLVGYDGNPDDTVKAVLDRTRASTVSILEWVPAAQHAAILAGTSTWDAAEAFTALNADAALRPGMNVEIPGQLAIATQAHLTKNDLGFIGGGNPSLSGQSVKIRRRANITPFLIGNEGDEGPFINAPTWTRIRFESFNTGPLWDADFFKINATIMGGFFHCAFDGDHLGAWLGLRRMQDMWIAWNIFRGGGHDAGDRAQIVFEEPQDLYGPGHVFLEKFWCNALRFHNNHHEWGINIGGTYTDRVTGATESKNRGVVCFKNIDTSVVPGATNLIRVSDSKFEPTTSRDGWNGTDTQLAAFQFDKCAQVQFLGCWYNQTKFLFDVKRAEAFKITGTYNNTAVPTPNERRLFGRFENCENVKIEVAGYSAPGIEATRCAGIESNIRSNQNFAGNRRESVMSKEALGRFWLQRLFATQTPDTFLVEDIRANGGSAIRSRELTTGTYGQALMSVIPTVKDDAPHGMTFRFKACTETAPVGTPRVLVTYYYTPSDTIHDADGATVTWSVPKYYAQETESGYTGIANVTAWKRHRLTGADTALTISGTTGADGNPNGGTVTVTEAVTNAYQVVIKRAALSKGILAVPLSGSLSITPTWYSVFIPPGVLALENVVINVTSAWEEAGLRIRILDYDFLDRAESDVSPFYPTSIATSGGGLIPGGNGWSTGDFVAATNRDSAGCDGWKCTDPSGTSGAGTWLPANVESVHYVHTAGTATVKLPQVLALDAARAVGRVRSFSNEGTGVLTIQRADTTGTRADVIGPASRTSITLQRGETCSLVEEKIVAGTPDVGQWAYIKCPPTFGRIYSDDWGVAQAIPTGAGFTKITPYEATGFASNMTADHTTGKITALEDGTYTISAKIAMSQDAATALFKGRVYIGGGVTTLDLQEFFGALGQTEMICNGSEPVQILAGQEIDIRLSHNQAGTVNATFISLGLSVVRLS